MHFKYKIKFLCLQTISSILLKFNIHTTKREHWMPVD